MTGTVPASRTPNMRTVHRLAAFALTVLLTLTSAPLYVCAQSAPPPCMQKTKAVSCHGHDDETTLLTCCCTSKQAPAQAPAAVAPPAPALAPVQLGALAASISGGRGVRTHDLTPRPQYNRDFPTLFSVFLL